MLDFLKLVLALTVGWLVADGLKALVRRVWLRRRPVSRPGPSWAYPPMKVKAVAGANITQGDALLLSEDGLTVTPTDDPSGSIGYAMNGVERGEAVEIVFNQTGIIESR